MKLHQLSSMALACVAILGCEKQQPPPMAPPAPSMAPAPPESGPPMAAPSSSAAMAPPASSAAFDPAPPPAAEIDPDKARTDLATRCELYIADEIKAACGIKREQPHFAFDSAAISSEASKTLNKLSDCFKTGPLKNRGMMLVGHADPRGTVEYNMSLGEQRADSVQMYLEQQGLTGKIETVSRGERDATGTDEASWARDRRVDVLLLPSGNPETLARANVGGATR